MNKTSRLSAKTLLRMAEYDRKFLTVTSIINSILLISMTVKLIAGIICTLTDIRK